MISRTTPQFGEFKIGDLDSHGYAYVGRHMDETGVLKHWFTTSAQTPLLDLANQKYTFDEAAKIIKEVSNATGQELQLPSLPLLSFMTDQRHLGALQDTFKPSRLDWILSSTFERTTSPSGRIKFPDLVGVARAKDGTISYINRSITPAEIRPVFSVPA